MIEYLSGNLLDLAPTFAIIDINGIGYYVNISLNSYERIKDKKKVKLYTHLIIREDNFSLFGFIDKEEREIFRYLISVSGVGATTARLMLSSLTTEQIRTAIATDDVQLIKSVKGIGIKTAQRIIVDLKDKIDKTGKETYIIASQSAKNEAIEALIVLGFNRKAVEKIVNKIISTNAKANVEYIIKEAFKYLK